MPKRATTKKPLRGKRVMVTRAREQAGGLCKAFEWLGAVVVEMPTIKTVSIEDFSKLDRAIENIADYEILIFTSENGVKYFFERMKKLKKSLEGTKIRVIPVGEKTAAALKRRKIKHEAGPKDFTGDSLAEKLLNEGVKGKKILIPRADIASDDLPRALKKAGATAHDIASYRTVPDDSDSGDALKLLSRSKIDCITFTSASTVRNFLKKTNNVSPAIYRNAVIACIGPVTVKEAVALGLHVDVVPEKFTADALASAVAGYFEREKSGGGK